MKFKKGQVIKEEDGIFICYCCDEEYACFAELEKVEGGTRTNFENTFLVSNNKGLKDNFKYENM